MTWQACPKSQSILVTKQTPKPEWESCTFSPNCNFNIILLKITISLRNTIPPLRTKVLALKCVRAPASTRRPMNDSRKSLHILQISLLKFKTNQRRLNCHRPSWPQFCSIQQEEKHSILLTFGSLQRSSIKWRWQQDSILQLEICRTELISQNFRIKYQVNKIRHHWYYGNIVIKLFYNTKVCSKISDTNYTLDTGPQYNRN